LGSVHDKQNNENGALQRSYKHQLSLTNQRDALHYGGRAANK